MGINLNDIPYDKAKQSGCHYCDLRHCCDYPNPWDEQGNWKECEHFVLGRCFRCSIAKQNGGKFVPGICNDINDYGGCENFKE